jgi:hypothetical protein
MHSKFLLIFSLFISICGNAQLTSNSPFTAYGLGEKGNDMLAPFTGLGNCGLTYFDSTVFNPHNPATYNTLGQGQPLFTIGLNTQINRYTQGNNVMLRTTAYPDPFALAFTLKKHFGLAFGLRPFTEKGYEIVDTTVVGSDSIEYRYLGKGNINRVFIGLSSNLLKLENTVLSVGGNIGYLFGTTNNERNSRLLDNTALDGGVSWNVLTVKSLHYEFGTYFKQSFFSNHHVTLAAVIEPAQKINATNDAYLFYGIIGDPEQYDTLAQTTGVGGYIKMPTTLQFGLGYTFWFDDKKANNSSRNSELALHMNYSRTDWTEFESSFENSPFSLMATKLTFGIQYTPERKYLENAVSSKFHEKIHYRAGFYQSLLPYTVSNSQLKDEGLTIGIGLPIITQNTLSSINLGLSLGQRSTGIEGALNEKYLGIQLGISIAPSLYERWFRKLKLD